MEYVDEDFGEMVHKPVLHPYSQYLKKEGNNWFWVVNTLSEDADISIQNALQRINVIRLQKHYMEVGIELCCQKKQSYDELKQIFLCTDHSGYFRIQFLTPTAFKRQGEYLIFPDLFCIYQSLINRFNSITGMDILNEDALKELLEQSRIVQYRLNSTYFSLERVKIPSFYGTISIRVNGPALMKRFVNMLFLFGEYSGIGIKTAIGMGAIKLL